MVGINCLIMKEFLSFQRGQGPTKQHYIALAADYIVNCDTIPPIHITGICPPPTVGVARIISCRGGLGIIQWKPQWSPMAKPLVPRSYRNFISKDSWNTVWWLLTYKNRNTFVIFLHNNYSFYLYQKFTVKVYRIHRIKRPNEWMYGNWRQSCLDCHLLLTFVTTNLYYCKRFQSVFLIAAWAADAVFSTLEKTRSGCTVNGKCFVDHFTEMKTENWYQLPP